MIQAKETTKEPEIGNHISLKAEIALFSWAFTTVGVLNLPTKRGGGGGGGLTKTKYGR